MIDNTIITLAISEMQTGFNQNPDYFSPTRDVFSARMQSYIAETKQYMQAAVIGEIGNNTFDHNFTYFPGFPAGAYCNTCFQEHYAVIADFGQGIRQSLSKVMPDLSSDKDALEAAFTKRISARSPEMRGNGLKFVSDAVQHNAWHLFFQSGQGTCAIDKNGIIFSCSDVMIQGCLAILHFGGSNDGR